MGVFHGIREGFSFKGSGGAMCNIKRLPAFLGGWEAGECFSYLTRAISCAVIRTEKIVYAINLAKCLPVLPSLLIASLFHLDFRALRFLTSIEYPPFVPP